MKCSEEERAYLRQLVFTHSANVMDPSRDYFIESRLQSVARQVGVGGVRELIKMLRHRPEGSLHRTVVEAMTINETSFFRDGVPFDRMQMDLIPRLVQARRSQRTLRLWSAACSSGQETYSLAMLLARHFSELEDWDIRILGTDISQSMIERARAGVYSDIEVARGLTPVLRDRYCMHVGHGWTMLPEMQARCNFTRLNLCSSLPLMPVFDGILLRNVMLYISAEDRIRLLRTVHRMLAPDGFLFLGCSEQLFPEMDIFQLHVSGNAYYYRPRHE
ncbi:MAG TPA: protein-glutamate O-methyltransferase CheR [Acidobacteriaceae bacterium]|jgi:chemotaxis protein methyltransferase CheR|nr:protein-glutamate O-methyltransferase CheR [Acidobacteriaceae bacterium]